MKNILPRIKKFLPEVKTSGFTLIELLIVIAIISGLAVVVFTALNPGARVKSARDARRQSDVASILTGIHTYIVDNGGNFPTGLSTSMAEAQISSAAIASGCNVVTAGCSTAVACVDLQTPAQLTKYVKTMPIDPSLASTSTKTNYSVSVDANNIVTIKACGVETSGTTISASR